MGRVQGYIQHSYWRWTNFFRYNGGAFVTKIRYYSISVFATPPGRHLIGWVDRFEVCSYYPTHIYTLHIVGSRGECWSTFFFFSVVYCVGLGELARQAHL